MITPLSLIPAFVILLVIVVLVNTLRFRPQPRQLAAVTPAAIDEQGAVDRLAGAIQFRTLSSQNPEDFNPEPFLEFQSFLERSFPHIHQQMERDIINRYSLLYKWQGSNDSLDPAVLLAHMDVVPVEAGTENDWTYDAFGGVVADGFVWGRGTLDMKNTLMALMETMEALISSGFRPERTLYLAFGHDEEIGGNGGAAQIARVLEERGVKAAFTLDEGMVILDEQLSTSKRQTAIIGIAEKGYVTLKIKANAVGGHSSMPPVKTAVDSLSRAIHSLVSNQMPASLSGVSGMLFDHIGPDMSFLMRLLFANRRLFKPLILRQLQKIPTTNAMMRTTTAPTVIQGGIKENVLPTTAYALVNFRILPGDSTESVITHARRVINDPEIDISIHGGANNDPSPISGIDTSGFQALSRTIVQLFPDTTVAPGLVLGGTDSKHYRSVTENSFRFAPVVLGPDDPGRIHGSNERISVENYIRSIQFYNQLIRNIMENDH